MIIIKLYHHISETKYDDVSKKIKVLDLNRFKKLNHIVLKYNEHYLN